MAESHQTGKQGETIARNHLKQNGYAILESNWQSGHREIDIIAQKDNLLVVIEVKARKTAFFGEPEEFVSRRKQKLLIEAANHYLVKNEIDLEVRFDIISVLFKGENHQLHHIEDAFYPTL
ncbi:MAG: YraN family protein [Bacteroidales bacterium]|jgi:putative endonuclease|nr:YraN family protein [Bacteroidales bacterium]NLM92431.1 YraN family protein [Bacteroidales bacterium]